MKGKKILELCNAFSNTIDLLAFLTLRFVMRCQCDQTYKYHDTYLSWQKKYP